MVFKSCAKIFLNVLSQPCKNFQLKKNRSNLIFTNFEKVLSVYDGIKDIKSAFETFF